MKVPRQLRAENLALHYLLQETEMVASPQSSVVSQSENSSCLDSTSAVSQSSRYLTIEREVVGRAQVQSDLNKLSAGTAVEHPSILVCTLFEKRKSDSFKSLCRL